MYMSICGSRPLACLSSRTSPPASRTTKAITTPRLSPPQCYPHPKAINPTRPPPSSEEDRAERVGLLDEPTDGLPLFVFKTSGYAP